MSNEQIIRILKKIDEKLRLLIVSDIGYSDNQRKRIKYLIQENLSDKEIADLLQVEKEYISKERCIIKKFEVEELSGGKE